ncbi:hypothetical protein PV10_01116 [Exophiala mesophila]|uniref:Uncharacterized protein n=1 Tax=Exophiala mesophila TaxID=212818 RepID=A0A0D1ZTU7_EXOME|nr:uncharacterized protein PV10_01116 [Exophiala mesophila]KIV97354.1 hypothetical protein PV10_01116 [Exophiala mesophila]
MQTRTLVGAGAGAGVLGLIIMQLGNQSQDRQYKKTLQYMHDGREKISEKFQDSKAKVEDLAKSKK